MVNGLEKLEDSDVGNSTQQGEPHTPLGPLVTPLPVWDQGLQLCSVSGAVAAGICGLGFYLLRKLFSVSATAAHRSSAHKGILLLVVQMLSSGYKMAPETSTEIYLSNG